MKLPDLLPAATPAETLLHTWETYALVAQPFRAVSQLFKPAGQMF